MSDVVSTTDNLQPDYLKKVAFKIFELGHGYRTCAQVLDLSIYMHFISLEPMIQKLWDNLLLSVTTINFDKRF